MIQTQTQNISSMLKERSSGIILIDNITELVNERLKLNLNNAITLKRENERPFDAFMDGRKNKKKRY